MSDDRDWGRNQAWAQQLLEVIRGMGPPSGWPDLLGIVALNLEVRQWTLPSPIRGTWASTRIPSPECSILRFFRISVDIRSRLRPELSEREGHGLGFRSTLEEEFVIRSGAKRTRSTELASFLLNFFIVLEIAACHCILIRKWRPIRTQCGVLFPDVERE